MNEASENGKKKMLVVCVTDGKLMDKNESSTVSSWKLTASMVLNIDERQILQTHSTQELFNSFAFNQILDL